MVISALNATFSAFYDRLLLDRVYRYMNTGVKHCSACGRSDREFAEKTDATCRMCMVASL